MSGLYVSYRRSDAPAAAARIGDHLAERFGDRKVFMDRDGPTRFSQAPASHAAAFGDTFDERVARHLATACAMVVVIGPGWLAPDGTKRPKLWAGDDYVRFELTTALERGIRVLPVLVEGAIGLPAPDALPPELAPLVDQTAIILRPDRYELDLRSVSADLAAVLEQHTKGPSAEDLRNPALGFTPVTLESGETLGPFDALRLQTLHEQLKQTLAAAPASAACSQRDRAYRDVLAPIIDHGRFQMAPRLTPALENAARQACKLQPYQPVIAAVDLSLLRRGRAGLVLTETGLFHYGDREPTTFISNAKLAAGPIEGAGGHYVCIGADAIEIPGRTDFARVLGFVEAAALVARQSVVPAELS
ncbi:MAG: toll/interleukin-1 receptor domain-containing protein [Pseudomonadota bacterium]